MKKFAIITAGGTGSRMESNIPKQFLTIAGIPILMHTIKVFQDAVPEINIILVLPENQHQYWLELCQKHDFNSDFPIVKGGETRFHSVKNGLQEINEESLVAIHDGVRPLIDPEVITNSYTTAEKYGNAVPALPVSESVRMIIDDGSRMVERDQLRIIQTPQTFIYSILRKAYTQDYVESFTDDASVVEATGEQIHLIEGNIENIKITRKADLKFAEANLR